MARNKKRDRSIILVAHGNMATCLMVYILASLPKDFNNLECRMTKLKCQVKLKIQRTKQESLAFSLPAEQVLWQAGHLNFNCYSGLEIRPLNSDTV
jgi:broad specificity phosphatase PhoE